MSVTERRDPRSCNRMDAETLIVHRRLEAWGRWNAEVIIGRRRHVIDRLMTFGAVGAGSAEPPISMPEEIDEVDQAIDALPTISRDRIRRYYLIWEPMHVTAHVLGLSVRDLQRRLRDDRFRIGAALDMQAARVQKNTK